MYVVCYTLYVPFRVFESILVGRILDFVDDQRIIVRCNPSEPAGYCNVVRNPHTPVNSAPPQDSPPCCNFADENSPLLT